MRALHQLFGKKGSCSQLKSRRPRRRQYSASFEPLERRELLAANVLNFQLTDDTGLSNSDLITSDGSVTGSVEWTAQATTGVTVEFDHDNDGTVEGSEMVGSSGDSFTYDPVTVDAALESWEGTLDLRYRTVEHQPGGDVVGSWTSYSYTLDRVAPTVTTFDPANGDVLSTGPTAASITFDEDVNSASINATNISVDNIMCSPPAQTVTATGGSGATITFTGGAVDPTSYTTLVSGVEDLAGNVMTMQQTAHWRVTASPTTAGIPDVNVDEDAPDTVITLSDHFSDEDDDPTMLTYSIENNTNSDLFSSTLIAGDQLTLDYADDAYGTADITIRATDNDGLWVETTFTVDVASVNDKPVISNWICSEGTTLWNFDGQVEDDGNVAGLTVTFGGLLAGRTESTGLGGILLRVRRLDTRWDCDRLRNRQRRS